MKIDEWFMEKALEPLIKVFLILVLPPLVITLIIVTWMILFKTLVFLVS